MTTMHLDMGDELIEQIARRAAELVQQSNGDENDDGWLRGADKIADYIDSSRSRIGLRWEHLDLGESPKVKVREQLYKGKRKRLKSKDGKRDLPLSPGMAQQLLAHRRDGYRGPKAPSLHRGGHRATT
jgi:hypothetical protein